MKNSTGKILWRDLTVKDASRMAEFYRTVVGWETTEHNMGDYVDYNVHDSEGNIVAGICHARGENSSIPPQWLIYITVKDVSESVRRCLAGGGSVVDGPRKMGSHDFCVIKDPAGAVVALIEE